MWTPEGLIRLDALAQRYGCRPSDLTAERDAWRAYCLDEAAALAGSMREAEAHQAAQEGAAGLAANEAAVELVHGIPAIRGSVPFIGKR